MKICTYTMTSDTGFAPNPFHGYCTLAACTPNHMHALLNKNDYIVGFFKIHGEPHLVYWMKVDEILYYDIYFHDPRFQKKKPELTGSWVSICGDNIYYRDESGVWKQETILFHKGDAELIRQDTRYAIVYIGRTFVYFGKQAYSDTNRLPKSFHSALINRGIKYTQEVHPHFKEYLAWLNSKPLGRHGDPRNSEKTNPCVSEKCKRICV